MLSREGIYFVIMNTLKHIDIEWPCVAVFNFICDISNNAEWRSDVIDAEWVVRSDERVRWVYREIRSRDEEEHDLFFTELVYEPSRKRTITLPDHTILTLLFEEMSDSCTRISVAFDSVEEAPLRELFIQDLCKLKNILEAVNC